MNKKYYSDSASQYQFGKDLYYIQNFPHPRKPTVYVEPEIDQEKLERKLFAKLQGHKGILMPSVGVGVKYAVLLILLPVYGMLFAGNRVQIKSLDTYRKVDNRIKPYYLKLKRVFQSFYKHIDTLTSKLRAKATQKKNTIMHWYQPKKFKIELALLWMNSKMRHVLTLAKNLLRLQKKGLAWVRVLSRYAFRVLGDWTLEVKQKFVVKRD